MRLAQKAGLSVAEVQKHEFSDRRAALLVSRFDREPIKDGFGRVPYLSARSLLRGYSQEALRESKPKFSYLLLAEARRAVGATDRLRDDLRELYRRMVFNILIDNTDDHESNHGLIFDKGWRFSPAFDVSPQLTRLGYQQMDVGAGGTESSLANALTSPEHFGLAANEAKHLVEQLIDATEAMNNVYREAGVDEQSRERARVHREAVISAFHQRR
jgi:serine/threonine-protein kinase HipA